MKSRSTDSFCASPADQLLTAVENNDFYTIKSVIAKNRDLINHTYAHMNNKSIIQIAVSNFAKTTTLETLELLVVELGVDLHFKTTENYNHQALHCAVLGQNPLIVRFVLQHINKDRINDVTTTGETALHLLIRDGVNSPEFEECVNLLLENDIDVNKEDKRRNTAIVIAVRKGYKNVVKKMLDSGKNIDIDNYKYRDKTIRNWIEEWGLYDENLPIANSNDQNFNQNQGQDLVSLIKALNENDFLKHPTLVSVDVNSELYSEETLLQMSCERNLKRIVSFLLSKGADVYKTTNTNKRTPLEIASVKGFYEVFQMLLPHYQEIPKDILATLLQNSIYKGNVDSDHRACLQAFLSQKINIPMNSYMSGNTPLHYAVKYGDYETILNLLKRGASLGNKNVEGLLPVEDIYPNTLEKHLDNCIKTENNPPCDRQSTVVIFDYKTFFPNDSELENSNQKDVESNNLIDSCRNKLIPETDVVLAISRNSDLRYLLKHPVISNFLFLKWYKMQAFFNLNFLFYLLFVFSLLMCIFTENTNWFTCFVNYVLCVTFAVLILRESAEILLAPKTYAKDFENYLELCLIFSTGYVIIAENHSDLLYKQISAVAILLSAVELMLLIGQYPLFSTYISVFKTVTWNFFKFMLWSAILIIAFTLSFYKIFHKAQTKEVSQDDGDKETDFFAEPVLTFIKVIVMLTGEFDANSLDLDTPLNRILFLVFVFLITITLFNVLNGLAVSDIHTIKNNAEIISLVERINRIVYVENMLVGNTALSKILHVLARYFCCCNDSSKDHVIPTWLARKVFLFPYSFHNNEVKMWLYYKGKIVNETEVNGCKPFKAIYMNSKVVKYTKEIVLREQNTEKVRLRNYVLKAKRNVQELLEKHCEQCDSSHLNVLSILNAIESIL